MATKQRETVALLTEAAEAWTVRSSNPYRHARK